jgi:hypothetical protein
MHCFQICALNFNLCRYTEGVLLPFDRAVGTALVYAFLDMKNIVGWGPKLHNCQLLNRPTA